MRLVIILLFANLALTSTAQTVDSDLLLLDIVAKQSASLHVTDTLVIGDSTVVFCDTMWKHYPHPLCLPLMYVPNPIPSLSDTTCLLDYSIYTIRRNALRYITCNHADLYTSVSDPTRLDKLKLGKTKAQRAIVKDNHIEQFCRERAISNKSPLWVKQADLSLQVTQSYATENWHQGAVNSFAMLANAKAFANYKKENISWENFAEWRIGVSTTNGDVHRLMSTTDDQLQVITKLGYQVHKDWYVSVHADFKTTLFPNYQKNSDYLNTTFLTPIRYTMGVGVDFKIVEGLTINVSPVVYKMVYANVTDSARINIADFGIAKGNKLLNEVGSSLQLYWKWIPIREIELETKFYFYTNYKQVETELELDIDFIINRYMSARLIIHPRYDGTIEKVTEQKSKIQFKELISVGFAHTFR